MAKTRDSRRDLFDRAVLWLIEGRVLLPGITTLSRLVTEGRRAGLEEINQALAGAAPAHMRQELAGTLAVPDGKKVSTLKWMRTPVTRLSGKSMVQALDRAAFVLGLGTGAVDCSAVAPVKLGRAGPVRDDRQGPEDRAAGARPADSHAAGDGAGTGGQHG